MVFWNGCKIWVNLAIIWIYFENKQKVFEVKWKKRYEGNANNVIFLKKLVYW